MPRATITVRCEACGDERPAFKHERVFHAGCPKRMPRRNIPAYLPAVSRKDSPDKPQ